MNILAFGLGASSGKLSLGRFDGDRLSIESVHRFDNGPIGFGNGLCWDFIGIWREMLADVSARPVLAGPEEASALGNMAVQLIAMGALKSVGEGRQLLGRCFAPRAYEPRAQRGLARAYQGIFRITGSHEGRGAPWHPCTRSEPKAS